MLHFGVLLVMLQVDSDTYVEPECTCGVTFCFRCAKDPHSPCTCKWADLGIQGLVAVLITHLYVYVQCVVQDFWQRSCSSPVMPQLQGEC